MTNSCCSYIYNFKIYLEKIIIDIGRDGKGYCCFVDQVLLVESNKQKNINLNNIINSASINSCDGSSIAFLVNILYNKNYKAYNGPEFFNKFIFNEFIISIRFSGIIIRILSNKLNHK